MATQKELRQAIETHHLMRTHGFPFLMPIIKSLHGQEHKVIEIQIGTLLHNHINAKYEKITSTTGIGALKSEWKAAFWATIDEDFIKKGQPREEIALKALKKKWGHIHWTDQVTHADESGGVDIKSIDGLIGISVKGFPFKDTRKYPKHRRQLIDNNFNRTFIIYVDETGKRVSKMEEVSIAKEVTHD